MTFGEKEMQLDQLSSSDEYVYQIKTKTAELMDLIYTENKHMFDKTVDIVDIPHFDERAFDAIRYLEIASMLAVKSYYKNKKD